MIILDTMVLSELMKEAPAARVLKWLSSLPEGSRFTTAVSEAETFYGLALLPRGRRREALVAAASGLFTRFQGRVLPFDSAAARAYAEIAAARRAAGRPISMADAQIAGITRALGAKLATRNVDDFNGCGIEVIDPWSL